MGGRLVFSILERLKAPGYYSNTRDLAGLMESVRRDLEFLLNTRTPRRSEVEEFRNLDASVYALGLKDFSAYDLRQPGTADVVAASIAESIRTYEPRLANVSVAVDDGTSGSQDSALLPKLVFRIRAELRVLSVREHVRVNAVFDTASGRLLADKLVLDA
jgi:type VI secretion system protein ImpF